MFDILLFIHANIISSDIHRSLPPNTRVTNCLKNLEMSGNLTAIREMSGILLKNQENVGKNLVIEKLPKTVYCKLHICIHAGILVRA